MKLTTFLFLLGCFFSSILKAKQCYIQRTQEKSVFVCSRDDSMEEYKVIVHSIEEEGVLRELQYRGVQFVPYNVFYLNSIQRGLHLFYESQKLIEWCMTLTPPHQKAALSYEEIRGLDPKDTTVQRIKEIADVLREAGVCRLPIIWQQSDFDMNIKNHDDVFEHFLCISNYESVFGADNIGKGGRGAFGIHPEHDRPGAPCAELNIIPRRENGSEIKDSRLHFSYEARLANAQCALKLYKNRRGFKSWGGPKSTWGSNRHCSQKNKARLNLKQLLKEKMCCSLKCSRQFSSSI